MKQTILFRRKNEDKKFDGTYEVKLPKIIKHVSAFEMQFGFKQQGSYLIGKNKLGVDSVSIPTLNPTVRI